MSTTAACLVCLFAGLLGAATVEPAAPTGWPIAVAVGDHAVTVFAPEVERLDADRLAARAAVVVSGPPDAPGDPVVGMVWLAGRIEAASGAEVAVLRSLRITRSRWPDQAPVTDEALSAELAAAVARTPPTWPLDALGEAADAAERARAAAVSAAAARPRVVIRDRPALLLAYDGPPRFGPADAGGLRRALNSDALVVRDPLTVSYWLAAGGGRWFRASAALGPFAPAAEVPAPIRALDDDEAAGTPAEEVVVATEPTALVWSAGAPRWSPVPGSDLLRVANASHPILRDPSDARAYLLIDGRWWAASDVPGPWSPLPPEHLPASFAAIPPDGPAGEVLAHVLGTAAADAALAAAELPRVAAVDPASVRTPEVRYDGPPRFEPIAGTDLRWAANSPQAVVAAHGRYFCCWNGIWYEAPTPEGPWWVAAAAPAGIDAIPASSPIFPVRYVRVYHASPTVIHVGYLPGYLGCQRTPDQVGWGWHDGRRPGDHGGHGSMRQHRRGPDEPIYSRRDDVRPIGGEGRRDDGRSGSAAGMAPRTDDATGGVYRLPSARPRGAPLAGGVARSENTGLPSAGGVAVAPASPTPQGGRMAPAPGSQPRGAVVPRRPSSLIRPAPAPRVDSPAGTTIALPESIRPPVVTRPESAAPSSPSPPARPTSAPSWRWPGTAAATRPETGIAPPTRRTATMTPAQRSAATPSRPAQVPSSAPSRMPPRPVAPSVDRSSPGQRPLSAAPAPRPMTIAPARVERPVSAPPRQRPASSPGHRPQAPSVPRTSPTPSPRPAPAGQRTSHPTPARATRPAHGHP